MLAYNLMNWFKEKVLGHGATKEMAGTIRWKFFWIPAKLAASGHKIRPKLADWWPYKKNLAGPLPPSPDSAPSEESRWSARLREGGGVRSYFSY